MSYLTVTEADQLLAHSAAWLALEKVQKERHLLTASLWMNYTYEWPGCVASCPVAETTLSGYPYTYPATYTSTSVRRSSEPQWPRVDCCTGGAINDSDGCAITGVPYALKEAQALAALMSVTVPLFSQPSTASDGGLTKKLIKAGPITIEKQWEEPTRAADGAVIMANVDAMLLKIASRRGTVANVGVFAV